MFRAPFFCYNVISVRRLQFLAADGAEHKNQTAEERKRGMLQSREQERMNGEKFHIRKGSLTFSADAVSGVLQPGVDYEGSFTIYGPEGRVANGFVISSEPAVKLLNREFAGARETIAFTVGAQTAEEEDGRAGCGEGERASIEGEFRILSDAGEYRLPYRFVCRRKLPDSSLGPVRNLIHFSNLARTAWQEAVKLFYQPDFARVLENAAMEEKAGDARTAKDAAPGDAQRRYRLDTLYRALSAREGNEHNVEEFLIAAGQKQPAEFRVEPGEITLDLMLLRDARDRGPVRRAIRIRRNGWGYTSLSVSLSGAFLSADVCELGEDSFHDGAAELGITIDPGLLHGGRNFGSVMVTPAYGETIRIPVTVSYGVRTALRTVHRREQQEVICSMMQEYLLLRGRKMDGKTFAEHMGHLIRRLQDSDRSNPMTALYRIHYLLTVHQEQDAVWELQALNRHLSGLDGEQPVFSPVQFDLEDDLVYSYRMYLTILCAGSGKAEEWNRKDEKTAYGITRDVIRSLTRKHRQHPDNFWIAWLLLYADAEKMQRPQEAAQILRQQYEAGSRSPILYMEYYQLLQGAAGLLHELNDFELQTLYFAAKRGLITDAVLPQINYLALRRKTYSRKLCRVLTMCYREEMPELSRRELLESICTLLIRGNMTDASCFVWYQRGVEAGLTITRLLDYYMLALPENHEGRLPQMVVRYYAYQNSLPWMQTACLYRNVLENREEYEEFYDAYVQLIDRFTLEQLQQRRISPDLICLYSRYLSGRHVLTDETASAAVPVIFSRRLQTKGTPVSRAVVVYDHLLTEQCFPFAGEGSFLPVYGEQNLLLLEDGKGDRRLVSAAFTLTPLMDYRSLTKALEPYEISSLGFDLYRSELTEEGEQKSGRGRNGAEADPWPVSERSEEHYLALVRSQEIPETYRCRLRRHLLDYYAAEGDREKRRKLLEEIQPEELSAGTRRSLVKELAEAGLNQKAYSWLLRFGCADTDGATLLKITASLPEENDGTEFSEIAYRAFQRGSYNDALLNHLAVFWDGPTQDLALIRLAMEGFGLPTGALSSRMLTQLLFTGEYGEDRRELLQDAMSYGMDTEQLTDVLAQSGHFYYTEGREMSAEEFGLIGEFGRQGVPLLDICRIAWLQNRSLQSGEIADKELEITDLFLTDLLERHIVFPFFRQFIGNLPGLQAYADETLVEYRTPAGTAPEGKVLYHYAMERGGVRDTYAAREMKEMYEGVYVTGFLLFFGEQMHYYITDDAAEKNIVESGTVGQDARNQSAGQDRFDAINEIAMLAAMGRDTEALGKLEQYSRKSYLAAHLFQSGRDRV